MNPALPKKYKLSEARKSGVNPAPSLYSIIFLIRGCGDIEVDTVVK